MGVGISRRGALRWVAALAAAALSAGSSVASANTTVTVNVAYQPSSAMSSVIVSDPIGVSGQLLAAMDNPYLIPGSVAAAAADLTAGTLRAFSTATVSNFLPAGGLVTLPDATATLGDEITVSGPGSSVVVTARLHLGGSFSLSGDHEDHSDVRQSIQASLGMGPSGEQQVIVSRELIVLNGQPDMDQLTILSLPADGGVSVVSSGLTPLIDLTASGVVQIGNPIGLHASLSVQGAGSVHYSATTDCGNTARLSLSLPAGYTYTSKSGVLLSQAGGSGLPLYADAGVTIPGADGGGGTGGTTGGSAGGTSGASSGGDGGAPQNPKSSGCSSGGDGALVIGLLLAGLCRRSRPARSL